MIKVQTFFFDMGSLVDMISYLQSNYICCLFPVRKNRVNFRYSQVFVAANELHNGRRWHWYLLGEMFSGSSRLELCGCVWLPLQYKCSEWTKCAIISTVTVKYPYNTQRSSSKHTCKYTHTHTHIYIYIHTYKHTYSRRHPRPPARGPGGCVV